MTSIWLAGPLAPPTWLNDWPDMFGGPSIGCVVTRWPPCVSGSAASVTDLNLATYLSGLQLELMSLSQRLTQTFCLSVHLTVTDLSVEQRQIILSFQMVRFFFLPSCVGGTQLESLQTFFFFLNKHLSHPFLNPNSSWPVFVNSDPRDMYQYHWRVPY